MFQVKNTSRVAAVLKKKKNKNQERRGITTGGTDLEGGHEGQCVGELILHPLR